METLIIHGCGGHARSVAATFAGVYKIIFVDSAALPNEKILGFDVYDNLDKIANYLEYLHHVGLGDLVNKSVVYQELKSRGCALKPLISPMATVMIEVAIGEGAFIGHNAYIGSNVHIGENSIINTGAVVEHDVHIGSNTHISINSTVAGYAKIGSNCMFGAGAVTVDKVEIGDYITVGAGAVVCENIFEEGVYVGIPAKKIR